MKSWRAALLLVSLTRSLAAQTPAVSVNAIRELIEAGRLADAETAARAGGVPALVVLGDVLVLRGQLTGADSVYRQAIASQAPNAPAASAALAEIAERRGDAATAISRGADVTRAYLANGTNWSSSNVAAAGRAYAVLGKWDPQQFHDALRVLDRAVAIDSSNIDAQLRSADLLLDKFNAPDARLTYQAVLKRSRDQPRALLGLARAAVLEGKEDPGPLLQRSLRGNPSLVPALLLLAEQQLQAEAWDSSLASVNRALRIDSAAVQGWAILGAMAWMRGDSAGYHAAEHAAQRVQPAAVDFYSEIAEAAGRQRRYADAVIMAERAVAADSQSSRALTVLGENDLRIGLMADGTDALTRAFAIDPYNLWNKNILDLLDQTKSFVTTSTPRFRLVAPANESAYLTTYLGPLLEAAYDSFAVRYQFEPATPIRVELYGRHADFSVRTVGLTGLGALGVSFGPVLVLDSPNSRDVGDFNYGSTSWHELAHTFTLGRSQHRMPRWVSEGLSVVEEHRAGRGWGFEIDPDFVAAYKGHALPVASHINDGLVRPHFPAEITDAYEEAALVMEMIEVEHGIGAIRDILGAYADGLDTPAAFDRVLHLTPDAFDAHFDAWFRSRYATILAAVDSSDGMHPATGRYVTLVTSGNEQLQRGQPDSAMRTLLQAQAIFPDDGSVDGPAWNLAHIYRDRGQLQLAIAQLHRLAMHNETTRDANTVEANLDIQVGDTTAALAALDRQQWITPYDIGLHLRIAELSEQQRLLPRAVLERRAIVALDPADKLEARYQLARVLLVSGDRVGARREVLQILEQAPAFEKAQALLVELQGSHT